MYRGYTVYLEAIYAFGGQFFNLHPLVGSYSLIESILSEEGFTRFQTYLEKKSRNERKPNAQSHVRLRRTVWSCGCVGTGRECALLGCADGV